MELKAYLVLSMAAFVLGVAAIIGGGSDLAIYLFGLILALSALIGFTVAAYEGYVREPTET